MNIKGINLSELYELLGRALYKHTTLQNELDLTTNSINSIRDEIHLRETIHPPANTAPNVDQLKPF